MLYDWNWSCPCHLYCYIELHALLLTNGRACQYQNGSCVSWTSNVSCAITFALGIEFEHFIQFLTWDWVLLAYWSDWHFGSFRFEKLWNIDVSTGEAVEDPEQGSNWFHHSILKHVEMLKGYNRICCLSQLQALGLWDFGSDNFQLEDTLTLKIICSQVVPCWVWMSRLHLQMHWNSRS